jgi:hypothetical protein
VGQLLGRNISPSGAFDTGKTMDRVLAIVDKTNDDEPDVRPQGPAA